MTAAREIDEALGPGVHWKDAYRTVEFMVRAVLDNAPAGVNFPTAGLVAHLYDGDNEFTRQRIFKGLKACAAHGLVAYWTPGPAESWGNLGTRRPKQWHRPTTAPRVCPHCGGML